MPKTKSPAAQKGERTSGPIAPGREYKRLSTPPASFIPLAMKHVLLRGSGHTSTMPTSQTRGVVSALTVMEGGKGHRGCDDRGRRHGGPAASRPGPIRRPIG